MSELKNRILKSKKLLFEKAYSFLNDKQKESVFTTEKPLLVLAGAGSGKTTVLVHRIAFIARYGNAYFNENIPSHLLCEEKAEYFESIVSNEVDKDRLPAILDEFAYFPAEPYRILAITFTNKAAREIKERLEALLGESANEVWSGTFHSICVRILRKYIERLGYDKSFTIYDTDDTKRLMTACLKELNIDDKKFPPKAVLNEISRSKDKLITSDKYQILAGDDFRKKTIAKLYEMYETKKGAANALDFDDIILFTVKLLSENEDIRNYYQNRFKYILVDEYQDTNLAQFYLIRLMCSQDENIMVVGDDDQSIYKFRGATIENILNFDRSFADAKTIKLEQNYRSKGNILSAANEVIKNNTGRKGKNLWTSNPEGERICVKECENQNFEASYIVDTIGRLVREKGYSFKDFAVLYRMNAQSNSLEMAFAKSGFSYRILGGHRFYDRQEIKDIVAYLCVINNSDDNLRLKRIINQPRRGIGDSTVELLEKIASDTLCSIYEVIRRCDDFPELARVSQKLKTFYYLIEDLKETSSNEQLPVLFEKVIEKSGYLQMLEQAGAEAADRIENVKELVSNAISFQSESEEATLSDFLEEVTLISDIDNYNNDEDAIVLMTIHSAKGLEFPVVFLPGLEENIFPGSQSAYEPDELEEERRLAYVAITRAKDELFMTYCRTRLLYGKTSYNQRSRFIDEIPSELIDLQAQSIFHTQSYERPKNNTLSYLQRDSKPASKPSASISMEKFACGDTVAHPTFGPGLIVNVTPMGADLLYEVAFEKVGTKKIMGSYAKFTKL